jgi:hypothetical protein
MSLLLFALYIVFSTHHCLFSTVFHCIFSITSLHFTTNLDMFTGSVVFIQFAVSCSIFIAVCIICNFFLLRALRFLMCISGCIKCNFIQPEIHIKRDTIIPISNNWKSCNAMMVNNNQGTVHKCLWRKVFLSGMNDHKEILCQFLQSTNFQLHVHWMQACANEPTT